jgi:hypothetical protein
MSTEIGLDPGYSGSLRNKKIKSIKNAVEYSTAFLM